MLLVHLNILSICPPFFLLTIRIRFLNELIALEITSCGRVSRSSTIRSFRSLRVVMWIRLCFQILTFNVPQTALSQGLRPGLLGGQKSGFKNFTAMFLRVSEWTLHVNELHLVERYSHHLIAAPSMAVVVTKLHCNYRHYLSLQLGNKVFLSLDTPVDTFTLTWILLFSECPFSVISLLIPRKFYHFAKKVFSKLASVM